MQKRKGFTLIEILVVMVIITIVGSMAILTISKNKTSQIQNAANQLTYLFRLAEDQALLQPTVLGATIQNNELKFYEFKHDPATNKDTWVPTENKILANIALPSGMSIKLKNEDDDLPPSEDNEVHPQIIFSSSGEANPFTLMLGKNSHTPIVKIMGKADGSLDEIRV